MKPQTEPVRTKRRSSWVVYLWPGLPQLTQWGSWTALFWALAASFLADAVVITVYIWPETFSRQITQLITASFVGIYLVGCFLSHRLEAIRTDYGRLETEEDLFPQAQIMYLRGRYFESETKLRNQLMRQPQDVPARILLIDLLKVTQRYEEALTNLEFLLDLPDAVAWRWEIFSLEDQLKALRNVPSENEDQILALPDSNSERKQAA